MNRNNKRAIAKYGLETCRIDAGRAWECRKALEAEGRRYDTAAGWEDECRFIEQASSYYPPLNFGSVGEFCRYAAMQARLAQGDDLPRIAARIRASVAAVISTESEE